MANQNATDAQIPSDVRNASQFTTDPSDDYDGPPVGSRVEFTSSSAGRHEDDLTRTGEVIAVREMPHCGAKALVACDEYLEAHDVGLHDGVHYKSVTASILTQLDGGQSNE